MAKIAPPTEKKTPVKRVVKKANEMKSNKATGQTPPDAPCDTLNAQFFIVWRVSIASRSPLSGTLSTTNNIDAREIPLLINSVAKNYFQLGGA
jgi:hypothetical protein